MIKLISAVALDGAIGKDNDMLWNIPEDLQYYKSRTSDNVVIVGRKTYQSLPKVALKNRFYIVVANNLHPVPDDDNIHVNFSPNPFAACELAYLNFHDKDIYIGGGQTIYEQLINHCDYAYITWIGLKYPQADSYFPVKKLYENFKLLSESDWIDSDSNKPSYKFSTYKRIG